MAGAYTSSALIRVQPPIAAATLLVAAVRLLSIPRGFWTGEEVRHAQALLTVDAGGTSSPVYVGLARLLNVFVRDPLTSLVVLSLIGSIAAALFLALASTRLFGNAIAGSAVALLAMLSPAMLVFGAQPNADSLVVAFVAAAFWFFVDRKPWLCAFAVAAAMGTRPSLFGFDAIGGGLDFRRELIARYVAHPWGGKFLSLPLLAAAAVGTFVVARRYRSAATIALAAFAAVQIVIAVTTATGHDGVRPALAAIAAVAFFAVASVARWPLIAAIASLIYSAASIAYAWPAVAERRVVSPPVTALRQAGNAVVIAAPDLVPFASVAGAVAVTPERIADFVDRGDVDLQLLVHGRSKSPDAVIFEHVASEACGKLTSERFHRVSLVPQPPAARFHARSGVYEIESAPDRGEWRWLSRHAFIELPFMDAESVSLRLALPEDSPLASNRVTINGRGVEVLRGSSTDVTLPASAQLTIRCETSFAPGDGRELAVQLLLLRQENQKDSPQRHKGRRERQNGGASASSAPLR